MRRFLHSTISPAARVVADELAVKLDTPGLAFDFKELFASDLSGRARAFQSMVGGGMKLERRRRWLASWWTMTMTTPRDYAPVLDRLLQREVSTMVEVPGTFTYTFNAEYLGGGNINLDDGTWVRDSDTEITIGLNDSNGIPFQSTCLFLPWV